MTRKRLMLAASLIAILAGGAFAQQDEKLGKAELPNLVRSQCAGRVRARRRHAALVLVQLCR